MTISTDVRKAGPFLGNDTAATFPFQFKVFESDDILVVIANSVAGSETTLVLDSDYTVSLNGDQNADPGGSITLTAGALATGFSLIISTNVDALQETDITNQGGFYPETITNALDKLTILVQQLEEKINRAITYSITDPTVVQLPSAAVRAGKILSFGADGAPSLLAMAPAGTYLFSGVLDGTQNGFNRVFTLTNNGAPLGRTPIQATVWCNYPLVYGLGYVFGPRPDQITFTNPPDADDALFALGSF